METQPLFLLPKQVVTRWASAENLDATPGAGGMAHAGRKGAPCHLLTAGETFTMAHAEGSGTVRRIWVTINDRSPQMLRGLVLRIYWDGAETPAVEAPLGDFFGTSLGRTAAFQSAWFDNPEGRSFNCRIPMPFRAGFRMTVTNDTPTDLAMFFYDVNFTLGEEHGPDTGYFHAHFRRENPTTLLRDFAILPRVTGRGRYLGCTLGAIADTARYGRAWWGEGEVKVYLDGDTDFPTLCGTGTEDYIATGWGQGQYSHLWHGCPIADHDRMQYSFYRLHGPDPVYFHQEARVTIQQLGGYLQSEMLAYLRGHNIDALPIAGDGVGLKTQADIAAGPEWNMIERRDDWSACAYFYLDRPVSGLPPILEYAERVAGLIDG